MLSVFVLLFAFGALSSLIPVKEIVKIVVILFTIPIILYLSVLFSKRSSIWTLKDDELEIRFENKTIQYPIAEITHIRSLTRSGGCLYVIYFQKKSPARYWRNKLFQAEDDQIALQAKLTESPIEYYKF